MVQVTVQDLKFVELSLLLEAFINLGFEVVERLLLGHLDHQLFDLD